MGRDDTSTAYRVLYATGKLLGTVALLGLRLCGAICQEVGREAEVQRLGARVGVHRQWDGDSEPSPVHQVREGIRVPPDPNIRVDAYRHKTQWMLDCSTCGPLGLATGYQNALSEVRLHMKAHGVNEPQETTK